MQTLQKYMQYVFLPLNAHDGCMYGNVSHLVFSRVRVARSLVFCGVFCSFDEVMNAEILYELIE
jgi:hypothetical protein